MALPKKKQFKLKRRSTKTRKTGVFGAEEEKDGGRGPIGARAARNGATRRHQEQGEARAERRRLVRSQTEAPGMFLYGRVHIIQHTGGFHWASSKLS